MLYVKSLSLIFTFLGADTGQTGVNAVPPSAGMLQPHLLPVYTVDNIQRVLHGLQAVCQRRSELPVNVSQSVSVYYPGDLYSRDQTVVTLGDFFHDFSAKHSGLFEPVAAERRASASTVAASAVDEGGHASSDNVVGSGAGPVGDARNIYLTQAAFVVTSPLAPPPPLADLDEFITRWAARVGSVSLDRQSLHTRGSQPAHPNPCFLACPVPDHRYPSSVL